MLKKNAKRRCLAALGLLTLAPAPLAAAPKDDWQLFADQIGELAPLIATAPMPETDDVQAEGYRSLARYLSNSLERSFDSNDPNYPRLLRMPNSVARIGWDNPDCPPSAPLAQI